MTALSDAESARYSRHFTLAEVGIDGQKKLKRAAALVIGAGGLGSPSCLYLAAAGVGVLGIVDCDVVEDSNLQRQVLHGSAAVGMPKTASAVARLRDLNPFIHIRALSFRLSSANALDLFRDYDVIIDGADNFPTRYLANDAAVFTGKPLVSGAILGFAGQVSVFNHDGGPCYRCLFPAMPPPGATPSCADNGVLGALPGVIGSLQALEALKILLGIGKPASGVLLLYDALAASFERIAFDRNPDCPLCGAFPTLRTLADGAPEEVGEARGARTEAAVVEITSRDLETIRDRVVLIDVRERIEWEQCRIDGALHIPAPQLATAASAWEPNAPLVLYCHAGPRSRRAAALLTEAGYRNVRTLKGGLLSWLASLETQP